MCGVSECGASKPAVWLCTTRPPSATADVYKDVTAVTVVRAPVGRLLCAV